MVSSVKYPIQRIINWYYGNFCTRKCFNKEERLLNCANKFKLFVNQNKELMITHKEFKDLLDNNHFKICKLKPKFKKRMVYWKQFEKWLKDPKFDPDSFD